MPCHVMLCHVMSCYVMLRYVCMHACMYIQARHSRKLFVQAFMPKFVLLVQAAVLKHPNFAKEHIEIVTSPLAAGLLKSTENNHIS